MSGAVVSKSYRCDGCGPQGACGGHEMTLRYEGASDVMYFELHDGRYIMDLTEVGVMEDLLLALRGVRAELAGHTPTTEGVEYG